MQNLDQHVRDISLLIMGGTPAALEDKLQSLVETNGAEAVTAIINTPAQGGNGGTFPTLLGQAAGAGKVDMGEILIRYGADVNQNMLTEEFSQTPLHAAYSMGHVKFAELLEDNNADKTAKDAEGKTPKERISDVRLAQSRDAMEKISAATNPNSSYRAEPVLEDLLKSEQDTIHVKNIGQGNNVEISSEYSAAIDFIEVAIEKFKSEHKDKLTHVSRKRGGNTIQVTGIADTELRNVFRNAISSERENKTADRSL
jgi:hypothetical protein